MSRPIHPACAAWPQPAAVEFNKLVGDIRLRGLINPIWLMPDGAIIDGKTRYAACEKAGVEPRFETYAGDDPVGFTISMNERRRHMSVSKLALIGEVLTKIKNGGDRRSDRFQSAKERTEMKTTKEIAVELGIGSRVIEDARSLKRNAEQNIIDMVEKEEVGVSSAAAFVRHTPRNEQREATAERVIKDGQRLRLPGKRATEGITVALQMVTEELRPLIKRIKEQSKRDVAMISKTEMAMIASEIEILLERWASGDTRPGRWPRPRARQQNGQQKAEG